MRGSGVPAEGVGADDAVDVAAVGRAQRGEVVSRFGCGRGRGAAAARLGHRAPARGNRRKRRGRNGVRPEDDERAGRRPRSSSRRRGARAVAEGERPGVRPPDEADRKAARSTSAVRQRPRGPDRRDRAADTAGPARGTRAYDSNSCASRSSSTTSSSPAGSASSSSTPPSCATGTASPAAGAGAARAQPGGASPASDVPVHGWRRPRRALGHRGRDVVGDHAGALAAGRAPRVLHPVARGLAYPIGARAARRGPHQRPAAADHHRSALDRRDARGAQPGNRRSTCATASPRTSSARRRGGAAARRRAAAHPDRGRARATSLKGVGDALAAAGAMREPAS